MRTHWGKMCCSILVLWLGIQMTTLAALPLASASPLRLPASEVQYWVEPQHLGDLSPSELPVSGWRAIEKRSVNVGKQSTPVWFRFTVTNPTAVTLERQLELRWINLRDVAFFAVDADQVVTESELTGLAHTKALTPDHNTSWVFSFSLAAGETKVLYLRLSSRFNVMAPVFLWEPQALQAHQSTRYVWYGLAFGVLGAMLLYNLSLYLFTRDTSYLYYSLYAFSVILYEAGMTGVGDHLFWGQAQWFRLNGFALSIYLSFLAAGLFLRNFLQLERVGGWMLHANSFFVGYWALSAMVLLLGTDYLVAVNEGLALVSCVVALATSVGLWVRGNVSARYFTVAWGGLIVFTVVSVLMMEGVLPYNPVSENGQLIGFVAEMLLLSFALAERINRERQQREQAQSQALAMQQLMNQEREEKLHAQEAMLVMQQDANQVLEERVAQRTQELECTMTNLEIANRELAKLSVTDPLTKVHNRRYFDETLAREVERSSRTQQPVALILVDIDHFKQFNDRYGHLVGDDCLRLVAATLREVVSRSSDLVARYGGEEFAVVLPDTDAEAALPVAERIRIRISQLQFIYKGERIPISASLGVAARALLAGESASALIEEADAALYAAKHQGRNRSVAASSLS